MNNFQGELTDISAKKEALTNTQKLVVTLVHERAYHLKITVEVHNK